MFLSENIALAILIFLLLTSGKFTFSNIMKFKSLIMLAQVQFNTSLRKYVIEIFTMRKSIQVDIAIYQQTLFVVNVNRTSASNQSN